MEGSFSAELIKLRKRPAFWVLFGVLLVLALAFGYAVPYIGYLTGDAGAIGLASALPNQIVANTLGGTPIFAGALMLVFGALSVGGEYGWMTMKTVLTLRPTRMGVLGGKLAVLAIAALAVLLAMLAVGALAATSIALVEGRPVDWPTPTALAQGIGAGWLIMYMWMLLGAALAFACRGVALPIGLGVVWILGVENLISAFADTLLTALRPLRDLLPGANAGSLVAALTSDVRIGEVTPGVAAAVGGDRAAITLACYLLLFGVACAFWLRRRDVI